MSDAPMSDVLDGRTVAVIGYGNQGAPQARALRSSGLVVRVGARPGGGSEARARADGFEVLPPGAASAGALVVAVLVPDEAVPEVWPAVATAIVPGAAVVFAHGFSLLYGELPIPDAIDVVLVSPTGPGRLLERTPDRRPLAAYLAVHRDASGRGWQIAAAYARRLGLEPTWRTTVREETEVDLFGEQTVLCGGMNALVSTAYEVLVAHGYSPEVAYLECVHQLKHLADLLHERGIAGLRRAISGTALYGDVTRGSRVIGPASRSAMEAILAEIQSGSFAAEWRNEAARGRPTIERAVREGDANPIEATRARVLGDPKATD
jgi:ketol-acid reductoisomerase